MYLSSRIAVCVGLAAVLSASPAARAELAARPAFAGIRPTLVPRVPGAPYSGIAPTIVGPRDGYPRAGIRPTIVGPTGLRRFRRGRGYGYGGYGLGYDGFETSDFGAPGIYPGAPGPDEALPSFALPPRPAPCPQIIEIGGGLAHKAKTHVVFGSPCRR